MISSTLCNLIHTHTRLQRQNLNSHVLGKLHRKVETSSKRQSAPSRIPHDPRAQHRPGLSAPTQSRVDSLAVSMSQLPFCELRRESNSREAEQCRRAETKCRVVHGLDCFTEQVERGRNWTPVPGSNIQPFLSLTDQSLLNIL